MTRERYSSRRSRSTRALVGVSHAQGQFAASMGLYKLWSFGWHRPLSSALGSGLKQCRQSNDNDYTNESADNTTCDRASVRLV